MNNKRLGMAFENRVVDMFKYRGYWVHYLSPDNSGSQPFDLIAAKDGLALAADCKTSSSHLFRMERLEWNQIFAFDKWMKCGNLTPYIIVGYKDHIVMVPYSELKEKGVVDLDEILCRK